MKKTVVFFSLIAVIAFIQALSIYLNVILGVDIPFLIYDLSEGALNLGSITLEGLAYAYSEGCGYFVIFLVLAYAATNKFNAKVVLASLFLAEALRWLLWWRWKFTFTKKVFHEWDLSFSLSLGVLDARILIFGLLTVLFISFFLMLKRKAIESKLLFTLSFVYCGMVILLHTVLVSYGFYHGEKKTIAREETQLKKQVYFVDERVCEQISLIDCVVLEPGNIKKYRGEHEPLDFFLSNEGEDRLGIFSYNEESDNKKHIHYYAFKVKGSVDKVSGVMLSLKGERHDLMHTYFSIFFIFLSAFSFVWINGFLLLLIVHSRFPSKS